jgi:hypothetical protein
MPIVLPTSSTAASTTEPRVLVILSHTKTGKTSSVLKLPKSLLIDLEDGSEFFDGTKMNLRKMSILEGKGMGSLLLETAATIAAENKKNGFPLFDFIAIDTLTVIESIAKNKATADYKNTVQGKNFTGTDVTKELPKGAGWAFFAKACDDLINPFKGLAGKCLILLAHAKFSTIERQSVEVQAGDIELTGKNRTSTLANADSIGLLYRNKRNVNQNVMSFKTSENDLVCGSRSPHLRNKEFVFGEYDPKSDVLNVNWELIFPSINPSNKVVMQEVQQEPIPS